MSAIDNDLLLAWTRRKEGALKTHTELNLFQQQLNDNPDEVLIARDAVLQTLTKAIGVLKERINLLMT